MKAFIPILVCGFVACSSAMPMYNNHHSYGTGMADTRSSGYQSIPVQQQAPLTPEELRWQRLRALERHHSGSSSPSFAGTSSPTPSQQPPEDPLHQHIREAAERRQKEEASKTTKKVFPWVARRRHSVSSDEEDTASSTSSTAPPPWIKKKNFFQKMFHVEPKQETIEELRQKNPAYWQERDPRHLAAVAALGRH